MKNSIMKKTWGILLGFGVSLATAAFVLTGCDLETTDPDTSIDNNLKGVWYATSDEATTSLLKDVVYEFSDVSAGSYGWKLAVGTTVAAATGNSAGWSYKRSDDRLSIYVDGYYSGLVSYKVNGNELTFKSATSTEFGEDFEGIWPTTTTFYRGSAPGGSSGGGGTATIEDLVTALNTLTSGAVTKADSTHVTFASSKTVTIPATGANSHITIPTGVTLTVAGGSVSGATLKLNGGTLTVNGTLSVKGADLALDGSSATGTIDGAGVIEKNTGNQYPVLALTNSQKLTIEGVTVKGTTGQSAPVITVTGTAELTLDGATVTGNTSTASTGGGLSIAGGTSTSSPGSKVTLKNNALVKGNTAAKGGGVYLDAYGELHIQKGTVYGSVKSDETTAEDAGDKNTATASNGGAAIYLNTADATVWYGGASTVPEVELTDSATYSTYFTASGVGSGAYTNATIKSDGTNVSNIAR